MGAVYAIIAVTGLAKNKKNGKNHEKNIVYGRIAV